MKKGLLYSLFVLAAWPTLAQQLMRFSLPLQMVDATNSLAQPGNVRMPFSPTNPSLEVVNWKAAVTDSNHIGEFVIKLAAPSQVGTIIAYEPGEVSFMVSNRWQRLAPGIEEGRKLQVLPLPPRETIEALKFAVRAQKTSNTTFQATLPFATLLPVRLINIAPEARVTAGSTNGKTSPEILVDGIIDPQKNFSTAPRDGKLADSPEWIQLMWKQPQALRGLTFFRGAEDPGLKRGTMEMFTGTNAVPTTWSTNGWQRVLGRSTANGIFAANQFFVSVSSLSTRALRITTTGELSRIGLGEIAVLRELGDEPAPRKK